MNWYIVESRVNGHTQNSELARYHVAAKDAEAAICEASKTHSRVVFNHSGPFMIAFRRARAAQRAFLAGVEHVIRVWEDAAESDGWATIKSRRIP